MVEVVEKVNGETGLVHDSGNRFVGEFLIPNFPLLTALNDIDNEISNERVNWQSSGAAEDLVNGFAAKLDEGGVKHHLDDPKQYANVVHRSQYDLYATPETTKRTVEAVTKDLKGLPPKGQQAIREFTEGMFEHQQEFLGAIKPLTGQREVVARELTDNWQTFMTITPATFGSFLEFLDADELQNIRDQVRPFLHLLQRRGSLLDTTTKTLVDKMLSDPDQETFTGFISQTFVSKGRDSAVRDWLLLLSYPGEDVDPEAVAAKILGAAMLPRDLRNPFNNYLAQLVYPLAGKIRTQLQTYSIQEPKMTLGISHQQVKGPKREGSRVVTMTATPKYREIGQVEIAEKPDYKMVVIRKGEPVELVGDLRERYIRDTAEQFSQTDYMREAVRAMVDSLQSDPWGLGVGKLTDFTITSLDSRRSVVLRRYRADKRPGVLAGNSQEFQEAKRLRAVYYFDPKVLPNTVILDEIMHHDVFDEKYTSGTK